MSAIERLDLRLEEPGDDPLSDKIFEILCKTLQPDGELSLESAARQISSLLPEGQPYSDKVGRFLTTCYEVAEQIPYSHPSMIKLVSVIDACLNSSKFLDATGTESDPTWRYQKLGETLRDWWDSSKPSDGAAKFVNFQTFAARIHQRGLLKGPDLAIWILEDAFERGKGASEAERNAYMQAASQWLLVQGDNVYQEVTNGKIKPGIWQRWHERLSAVTNGKIKPGRWQRWHERLSAVTDGKTDEKVCGYSEDTMELARQASVAMDAVKRRKAV